MKIFHFLKLDQYHTSDGILQKSFVKVNMWQALGHEVKFVIVFNEEAEKGIIKRFGDPILIKRSKQKVMGAFRVRRLLGIFPKHEQLLLKEIERSQPDIIYHRSFEISKFTEFLTKIFPTVIEINGNQFGNLRSIPGNPLYRLLNRLRAAHLKLSLKKFLQHHKGVVVVTHELLKFYQNKANLHDLHVKAVVIPNSINTSSEAERKRISDGEYIQLVFLGSPNMKWHGIDLIIEMAKQTQHVFRFHLIGEQFSNDRTLPPNVQVHGYLSKEEYRKILIQSHIGIGTLSLDEAGIKEASPLKIREYADAGLPVIIGYQDTAFINHGVPEWALVLPPGKESILSSIPAIIEYCKLMKNYIVPPEAVLQYFSLEATERARLNFFENLVQLPGKAREIVAERYKEPGLETN
jgi:glycosyltransferase involved in cell wall biosynthesis